MKLHDSPWDRILNAEINWRGWGEKNKTGEEKEIQPGTQIKRGDQTHVFTQEGIIKRDEKQKGVIYQDAEAKQTEIDQMRRSGRCLLLQQQFRLNLNFLHSGNDRRHQRWREWWKDREEAAESLITFWMSFRGQFGEITPSTCTWNSVTHAIQSLSC